MYSITASHMMPNGHFADRYDPPDSMFAIGFTAG